MSANLVMLPTPKRRVGELVKICKTLYEIVNCSSEGCENLTLHNLTDKRFKFDNLRCRECGAKFAFDYDKAREKWEEKFEKPGI